MVYTSTVYHTYIDSPMSLFTNLEVPTFKEPQYPEVIVTNDKKELRLKLFQSFKRRYITRNLRNILRTAIV